MLWNLIFKKETISSIEEIVITDNVTRSVEQFNIKQNSTQQNDTQQNDTQENDI